MENYGNTYKSFKQRNHIPLPQSVTGTKVGGIDLSPRSMSYLKANWPNDYRRVLAVFPLAEGQASRAADQKGELKSVKDGI